MAKGAKKQGDPGRSDDKRRRILDAATVLFGQYGFRRTSVDLLATHAAIAKPTLYAYFTDKEDVFRAVCVDVCEGILARADAASRAEGAVEARVAAVLDAKFTYVYGLVHASPHAAEILHAQDQLGADVVARTDRSFQRILARVLEEGVKAGEIDPARAGLSTGTAASLLMRCAHGASFDASSAASHSRHIAEMARVIVGAMGTKKR
jgi:AcrR family transcriptional regulator